LNELATSPAHSLFGPSSLERRELCPGSYRLEKDSPRRTGPDAERGRKLHKYVENNITDYLGYARLINLDEGKDLDSYDKEAVKFCTELSLDKIAEYRRLFDHVEIYTESRLDLSYVPEIGHGTADLIIVTPELVDVTDFKFGQYPVTPAPQNRQLESYAIGVAKAFKRNRVVARILQPALNVMDEATFEVTHLGGAAEKHRDIVAAAMDPNAPLVPGPKQCRNCKAAGTCPELAKLAPALPLARPVTHLTPAEMSPLLALLPQVKKWAAALEEAALAKAQAGETIPGYEIGPGRRSYVWADPATAAAQLQAIAAELGKDAKVITCTKTATPAQIREAWGKSSKVREALEKLITEKPGEPTLKPVKPALPE
jgi:hypothetical protein